MSRAHSAVWSAVVAVIAAGFALCLSSPAMAFNGPASGQAAGTGNGAIGVGSNQDISIGTSTTDNATKLLLVASSTGDTSSFVFKTLDSSQNPLLIIRNDGSVGIGTASLGTGLLDVGGLIYSSQGFTGSLNAANVSAGTFGANTGNGNYTFPGNITVDGGSMYVTNGDYGLQYVATGNVNLFDGYPGGQIQLTPGGSTGSVVIPSGDVGIGTTSPGALLDLANAAPYLRLTATVGTNYVQQDFVNSGGTVRIGAENSSGGGLLNGTSPYAGVFGTINAYPLQFSTDNVVRETIASNGNVGIGTASPGATLDVHSGSIAAENSGTNFTQLWEDNALIWGNGAYSGGLRFGNANSLNAGGFNQIMIVGYNNNVGIGTSTPSSLLTVAGNMDITGNLTVGGTFSGGALTGTLNAGNVSAGTFGNNTGDGNYIFPNTLTVTGATNFNAAGATTGAPNLFNSGTGVLDAMFGSGSTSGFTADQSGGAIRFNGAGVNWGDVAYFPNGGGSGNQGNFRFMLSGSVLGSVPNAEVGVGSLYSAGNVGIGTTAPSAALDVRYSTGTGVNWGPSASVKGVLDYNSSDALIYGASGYGLELGANGTPDYIRINNAGEVGIGTASPGATLDVEANNGITLGLAPNGGGRLVLANNPNDNSIYLEGYASSTAANANAIYIAGYGATNIGTINLDANTVAMDGNATVVNTLAVTNTSGMQNILIGNQDSGGVNKPGMILGANGAIGFGYGTSWSGSGGTSTQTVYISSSGGLELGTGAESFTDPGFGNLAVSGNATVSGTLTAGAFTGTLNAGNVSAGTFGANTGSGNYTFPGALTVSSYLYVGDNGSWIGYNNGTSNYFGGTTDFRETGSPYSVNAEISGIGGNTWFSALGGNVGIGTASPSWPLTVVGTTTVMATNGAPRVELGTTVGGTSPGEVNILDGNSQTTLSIQGVTNYETNFVGGSSGASIMYFNAAGNVGIGTTNPGYTLEVNGGANEGSIGVKGYNDQFGFAAYADGTEIGTSTSMGTAPALSVMPFTTARDGIVVRDDAGQTAGYLLRLQDASGNDLFNVSYSGTAVFSDTVSVGSSAYVNEAGDIGVSRNAASTTGAIYLGSGGSHYLFFDGSNYNLASGGLNVGGNLAPSGDIIPNTVSNSGGGTWEFGPSAWGGTVSGASSVTGLVYSGGSGSQLFTLSSGPGQASMEMDGSLFLGDGAPSYNPYSLTAASDGDLAVNGDAEIGGNVNVQGTITSGGFTGTLNAANVSAGTFGSNTGNGSFWFPSSVIIGGTVAPSWTMTLASQYDNIGWYSGNASISDNDGYGVRLFLSSPVIRLTNEGYQDGNSTGGLFVANSDNVGIGTPSPGYPLVVNTTGSNSSGVQTTVLSVNTLDSSGSGARLVFHQALDEAAITGWDSGSWGGYLSFSTAPSTGSSPGGTLTERMRILDNGNVGIGTTSPSALLEINGTTRSDGQLSSYGGIYSSANGSGDDWFPYPGNGDVYIRSPYTYITNTIQAENGNWSIGNGGNITVGATNSTYLNIDSNQIWADTNGSPSTLYLQYNTSASTIINSNGGDVGIGTTAPDATLDVNGHVDITGTTPTFGACGSGPVFNGGSTDSAGTFIAGSGAGTSCIVNFASAFTTPPACVITAHGYGQTYELGSSGVYAQEGFWLSYVETTYFEVTTETGLGGMTFSYVCIGN